MYIILRFLYIIPLFMTPHSNVSSVETEKEFITATKSDYEKLLDLSSNMAQRHAQQQKPSRGRGRQSGRKGRRE